MQSARADIFKILREDILRLQGLRFADNVELNETLGPIADAFPNRSFPIGSVHEFLSPCAENLAATSGFLCGLLSTLIGNDGAVLWISSSRKLFPPGLKNFSIDPGKFVFIDTNKEKEILWAIDESLKCGALAAVVGELNDLSFTASRRLQLAVEKSHVTGFILNNNQRLSTTACVSRWKISSLSSEKLDELPGVAFAKWRVELQRIRNGKPGTWDVQWTDKGFQQAQRELVMSFLEIQKKAG
ncbi:MAG TPA: Error-prone repair protein ImuA [Cyclobacteriaceae bacterium]|jgi:protein ImuA|nr:Error-prone repair protein ImuA [Cyclobacteriaceae bacterium]